MSLIFAEASLKLLPKCFNLKLNLFLSGELGVLGLDSPESAMFFDASSFASEMAESSVCWYWGEIGLTVAIAKCFLFNSNAGEQSLGLIGEASTL